MAEAELKALQEGYEASLRQLRTLLDAQARLRSVAEETAAENRAELERVAEVLCAGLVDDLRVSDPMGLTEVTPKALADAVLCDVQQRLSRLSAAEMAGQNVGALYEEATEALADLRKEKACLEASLVEQRQRAERTEMQLAILRQSLEDAKRRLGEGCATRASSSALESGDASSVVDAVPSEQLPQWMQEWQRARTYERDAALLRVLAETSVARRTEAAQMLGERVGVDPRSGSVSRLFTRCQQRLEVIELIEAQAETHGRATHLIRLTEKGRDACRLMWGLDPVPCQTTALLERHGSPVRALLTLEAGDLLRGAGYEVDVLPGAIDLPDAGCFVPDIAAARNGQSLFVAVARGVSREVGDALPWRDYYQAGGGAMYVVVPDRPALDQVKSQILFWAGQRDLMLRMTSISDARGKQGQQVWLFKRG